MFAAAAAACVMVSLPVKAGRAPGDAPARGNDNASPIYVVTVPAGYRQWQLIAPSHEAGNLDELRAMLGNDIAIQAFRDGALPFPDGAMIARLAWKHEPSLVDNKALGHFQAFVPGPATTVQFMVKDSKKYAATGGWGFGNFVDGKPVNREPCYPCHAGNAKEQDFVFTHYAP
jgi:Cytochrome P460